MIGWAIWLAVHAQEPASRAETLPAWQQKEAASPLVERNDERSRGRSAATVVETVEVSPWKVGAWTVVVAGLLAALFVGLRRWIGKGGEPAPPEAIRVTARRRITPALEILVVEISGRRLVLGAGKDSMNTLAELDPNDSVPPVASLWEKALRTVGGGRDTPAEPAEVAAGMGVGETSPS